MTLRKLFTMLSRSSKDRAGTPAVEYGIIVAAFCLVAAGVIWAFGDDIARLFLNLKSSL